MIDLDGSWGSSASLNRTDRLSVLATNEEEGSVVGTIGTSAPSGAHGQALDDDTHESTLTVRCSN